MPSIGGIKAGNAYVVIGAIDDTGKMLSKIGRRLQKWGDGLKNFGLDLGFKTALALTPAALGIAAGAKFSDLMLQTKARTQATTEQIDHLSEVARKAGRDLGLTATQIAEIFAELSTKDFNIGEMKEMVRPIALLAKATGTGSDKDMKQAGALMSQTLQSFHLGADQAAKVADVLTVVANKSNFALDDLAEAMAHVSSTASMMGMSFEETIAIMAQMRNVGIQAESASIGLRNIILNSANAKETTKFNEALVSMGIAAVDFSDKMGNLENPTKLLFTIFDRIKNLGSQQRASLLENLFGKRAINPAAAAGAGKDTFKELMKSIADAKGEAEKISKVMETGTGGSWRAFIGAVQDTSISLEKSLAPALKMVGFLANKYTMNLSQWISIHPRVTTLIAATGVGLFGLAAALFTTGIAVKALGIVITALSGVFLVFEGVRKIVTLGLSLMSGILSVITIGWAAITSAATIGVTVISGIGTAFTVVMSILSTVVAIIPVIISALTVLGTLGPFLVLGAAILAVLYSLVTLFKLIDKAGVIIAGFVDPFLAGLGRIKTFFGYFGTYLKDTFTGLWNTIVSSGLQAFAQLSEGMALAFQLTQIGEFEVAWKVAIASVNTAFMNFWDEVSVKAGETFTDILTGFFQVFTEMSNTLSRTIAKMSAANPMTIALQELNEGMGAGLNSMARGIASRKKKEFQTRDDMEQRKMWRERDLNDFIAGVKEDMPDAAQPLAEKLRNLYQQIEGGHPPGEGMGHGQMKPLEGLEKGTIEAAKAAYEGSGDAGQRQLDLLAGILNGLVALNNNLQVA